jgi:hypothetical protein
VEQQCRLYGGGAWLAAIVAGGGRRWGVDGGAKGKSERSLLFFFFFLTKSEASCRVERKGLAELGLLAGRPSGGLPFF